MRSFRTLLADLASALVVVLAGVAALAALAAQGGRTSLLLDLLGQFALVFLAAGLAALVLALVVRRWARKAVAALGFVTIIASGALLAPEFLRDAGPTAAADAPRQIKVIQFNALRVNDNIAGAVDWIVAQHPDIVTVQETRRDLRDALVARTGWQVAGAAGDLMIFSRAPRIRMDRPALAEERLHWVNATYPSTSGPYEVVTVHLDWPLGPSQSAQWAGLADLVRRLPNDRLIVAGDFNAAPFAFAMRRGERALGLQRRDRALASFPAKWQAAGPVRSPVPILPIDHVYAGRGWATVKVERGPSGLGSDHYPLIVTLAPISPGPLARR
jgi:endonuclease/exonuclease/phosphatase (EEP) superfamily protein YafD